MNAVRGGGGLEVVVRASRFLLAQVPQLSTSPLPSQPTSWMTGSCCSLPARCCWQLAALLQAHTNQHSARWFRMSCSSVSFIWSLRPEAVSGERRLYDCTVDIDSASRAVYDWR